MTRKEERIEASIDYQMSTNPTALGGAAFEDMIRKMNVNHSFVAGAEWADKTMLDRVCNWLKENMCFTTALAHGMVCYQCAAIECFISDLRKAIEE